MGKAHVGVFSEQIFFLMFRIEMLKGIMVCFDLISDILVLNFSVLRKNNLFWLLEILFLLALPLYFSFSFSVLGSLYLRNICWTEKVDLLLVLYILKVFQVPTCIKRKFIRQFTAVGTHVCFVLVCFCIVRGEFRRNWKVLSVYKFSEDLKMFSKVSDTW